jgi:hypothetical protein
MKKALAAVTEKAREDDTVRPSLLAREQGCPAPDKLDYEPGQVIETICGQAGSKSNKQ